MDILRILEPGPFTTIQDRGRYGYQRYGIPISGALDKFAYRVANLLVGNPETSAVLEITFAGPKLEVLGETALAVTGADVPVLVNNEPQDLWTAFEVRPGDVVAIRPARRGVRAYLSVAGGILVPEVMGSRSTYVNGRLGGLDGRLLRKGDILPGGSPTVPRALGKLPDELRPTLSNRITLRAIPGPQEDFFDEGLELFFTDTFTVSAQADRMGYRLDGPTITGKVEMTTSIISEASVPGGVQVPPDGRPIIILGEQTAGGYAKIATVIAQDLDLVAQARPGDELRFMSVDPAQARKAHQALIQKLVHIRSLVRSSRP
ncbi:MAG: biotin-dependent carboxyltransferase family protein [Thermodesulfobacteriota bacterium]